MNGHDITFEGTLTMAFRMNDKNELIAFEGQNCSQVEIDGKAYKFSDKPMKKIAFVPSLDKSKQEIKVYAEGEGQLLIPLSKSMNPNKIIITDERGKKIKYDILEETIAFEMNSQINGKWLTLIWVN